MPITSGKVSLDTVSFMAGDARYTARVNGDTMEGTTVMAGKETKFRVSRTARVATAARP
jgi:hypothetical protein